MDTVEKVFDVTGVSVPSLAVSAAIPAEVNSMSPNVAMPLTALTVSVPEGVFVVDPGARARVTGELSALLIWPDAVIKRTVIAGMTTEPMSTVGPMVCPNASVVLTAVAALEMLNVLDVALASDPSVATRV
jgi:hypothetical protein